MQASMYPKHLPRVQRQSRLFSSSSMFHPYVFSLAGGLLIGLASWLLLASLGRVLHAETRLPLGALGKAQPPLV